MIAGVVLVGGRSQRMGQNKALLDINGVPLVERMTCLAKEAGCGSVYLSGALEGYACINDFCPHRGPVGGIVSVMKAVGVNHESFLFLPVDMPHLTSKLLKRLINADQQRGAYFENYPLPLFLKVTNHVLQTLGSLQSAEASVFSLIEDLRLESLSLNSPELKAFVNINTPELYRRLKSQA